MADEWDEWQGECPMDPATAEAALPAFRRGDFKPLGRLRPSKTHESRTIPPLLDTAKVLHYFCLSATWVSPGRSSQ